MKTPIFIAIVFSLAALIVKLIVFTLGFQHGSMEIYYRYILMGLLLLSVYFGIKDFDSHEEHPGTFPLLKSGMRTAIFFTLIVSAITYIYYAKIDTEFFPIKHAERIEIMKKEIPIMLEKYSREEVIEKLKTNLITMRKVLSPYFQAVWTTFGLTFMGMVYSIIFTLLYKKFNKKDKLPVNEK